jgi:hypothetical protein
MEQNDKRMLSLALAALLLAPLPAAADDVRRAPEKAPEKWSAARPGSSAVESPRARWHERQGQQSDVLPPELERWPSRRLDVAWQHRQQPELWRVRQSFPLPRFDDVERWREASPQAHWRWRKRAAAWEERVRPPDVGAEAPRSSGG